MSPRTKIALSGALLLALGALAGAKGLSVVSTARAALAIGAAVGLAWWFLRDRGGPQLLEAPRLNIVSRTGLANRSGVALVEVDGQPFLVVHGDGFAEIRAVRNAP